LDAKKLSEREEPIFLVEVDHSELQNPESPSENSEILSNGSLEVNGELIFNRNEIHGICGVRNH
jgi:hypothetical protein